MAMVRFYYDVYVDEDDIRENLELDKNVIISDKDIFDRAKYLFDSDIYDRAICIEELECDITDREEC